MAGPEHSSEIPSLDPSTIPEQPDDYSDQEASAWKNAKTSEFLKDSTQDRSERKTYAGRIFRLLIVWLAVVGSILLLHGFSPFTRFNNLSDAVLMTLIGSTTASVVGIFVIVAKYLFPQRAR